MPSEASYTSNLRVREYNPNGQPQSKPIRPEQWKKHEGRIRSLHAAKYKRAEALEKLKADCGCEHNCSFNPSYVLSIILYQSSSTSATENAIGQDFSGQKGF
jgi:hypothetical protein